MTTILIADRLDVLSTALVRAFGRQGDCCDVAWSHGPLRRALKSRFVRELVATTSPFDDARAYARDIARIFKEGDYDVVVPIYPDRLHAILEYEPDFAQEMPAVHPTLAQLELAENKVAMDVHVRDLGIATPRSFSVRTESDLRSSAAWLEFPVVLKAANSPAGSSHMVRFATDTESLHRAFEELNQKVTNQDSWHVQEFIPGYIHDASSLWSSGTLVQMYTSIRKLMYPVTGGVGATTVSTHNDGVRRLACEVLESMGWSGPAGMEFKLDPRDGRYKFIEMNPRFWGVVDFGIRMGLDFAGKYRDLALGLRVSRDDPYSAGVRYKFLFERGAYARLQQLLKLGMAELDDPQAYAETHYDFDLRDPLPDLPRIIGTIRGLLQGEGRQFNMNLPPRLVNKLACELPLTYGISQVVK